MFSIAKTAQNRLLMGFLFLLVATLLIGRQYNASFAGGDGYLRPLEAKVAVIEGSLVGERNAVLEEHAIGDRLERGEFVRTGDDSRALLRFEGVAIGLDERTDIELVSLTPGEATIKLLRGRIMVQTNNFLTVETNLTSSSLLSGGLSMVNFDFLETIAIHPVDSVVAVELPDDKQFISQTSVELKETPPMDVRDIDFAPFSGAGADFYHWFESVTDFRFETAPTLVFTQ